MKCASDTRFYRTREMVQWAEILTQSAKRLTQWAEKLIHYVMKPAQWNGNTM